MQSYSKIAVLIYFIAVPIIYHLLAYTGHFGYDDLHYAKLANDMLGGKIDWQDHYSYRWTLLFLTAFFYQLFGVSDVASCLPPLIITSLTIYFVYRVLKDENLVVIIIGLALTTLNNWSLFYADKIMPDVYVNLFIFLVFYVIYSYKFSNANKSPKIYGFYFGIAFLFGFISKETVLLIVPVLIYLFTIDFILRV